MEERLSVLTSMATSKFVGFRQSVIWSH